MAAKASGLSDVDICSPRAYGTSQKHRVIGNASAYWKAATTLWPGFLQKHQAKDSGAIPRSTGLKFLRQDNRNCQELVPGVGDLSSYPPAVDLVYAGVFTAPPLANPSLLL